MRIRSENDCYHWNLLVVFFCDSNQDTRLRNNNKRETLFSIDESFRDNENDDDDYHRYYILLSFFIQKRKKYYKENESESGKRRKVM